MIARKVALIGPVIVLMAVLHIATELQNSRLGSSIASSSAAATTVSSISSPNGGGNPTVTHQERGVLSTNVSYPQNPIFIATTMKNLPRPNHDFLIQPTFLKDDLSIGKSCKKAYRGWECRDCGDNSTISDNWNDCLLIPPRGICKPFRTWDWDPRQVSHHDPLDPSEHRHVLYHYGMPNQTYSQIPCERLEDCWDMTRCSKRPVTVYGYGETAVSMAKLAAKRYPDNLQWVEDPQTACVLLATRHSFATPEQMHTQPLWNAGRNHLLWDADAYFGENTDRPFSTVTNFDYASLATAAMMDANIRLDFDISTATMRMEPSAEFQQPAQLENLLTAAGSRPTLVTFKGNIFHWDQIWWQHRYLAYEYWERAPDVLVDVVCKLSKRIKTPRRKRQYETSRDDFAAQLLNSTFAFCPGGGSVGSFRFAEALSLGAIPVVTSEFVAPLAPEVDWSGCLVRVSEARILDVPRILRQIPEDSVMARQARCRFLFDKIIGWSELHGRLDPITRILPLALRIWSRRIENYHRMREQGEAMLNDA